MNFMYLLKWDPCCQQQVPFCSVPMAFFNLEQCPVIQHSADIWSEMATSSEDTSSVKGMPTLPTTRCGTDKQ
jgi:hypothetical protein